MSNVNWAPWGGPHGRQRGATCSEVAPLERPARLARPADDDQEDACHLCAPKPSGTWRAPPPTRAASRWPNKQIAASGPLARSLAHSRPPVRSLAQCVCVAPITHARTPTKFGPTAGRALGGKARTRRPDSMRTLNSIHVCAAYFGRRRWPDFVRAPSRQHLDASANSARNLQRLTSQPASQPVDEQECTRLAQR